MKKTTTITFVVILVALSMFFALKTSTFNTTINLTENLKEKHKNNLENSPFKESLKLSKAERKANSQPPNKYFEQMWELTMNPELGYPTTENLRTIQKNLSESRKNQGNLRVPGDAISNSWIERGPNNVGGRTRGVMFDPNDPTDETVFAGGVSGGLYKNTNISNANSQWQRVDIPENLTVTKIVADPNNSQIFYVGTGESYVSGSVNGNGIWKSTDGGITWNNVLGGVTGESSFQSATSMTINSPSSIAGDYLYYPTTSFGSEITEIITNDIVLMLDDEGETTDGCNTITNSPDLNGKIALVRRGECNFTVKVKAAQDAGAVATIVMNNISGTPIAMGGEDASITIPAVMVSKEDGDLIESALRNGSVNVSLKPKDGDFTGVLVPGIQHINDIAFKNNNGVSELYVATGETIYGPSNIATYLGADSYGLYKTVNGGNSWTKLDLPKTEAGNEICPNDIEIGTDGDIWISTIHTRVFEDGGGLVFRSTDGVNFSQVYSISGADRTQIAVSESDPNKVYVLAELTDGGVTIKRTNSKFVPLFGVRNVSLPNDDDPGIAANDFTRGQAFFDLVIAVDPTNPDKVYTGGIDLFKSNNQGDNWEQFSHWTGSYNHQYVHADQHAIVFSKNNPNKMLFGNDGGVYYSDDGGETTEARNNGFNVTQFYTLAVAPTTAFSGDMIVAGAQDNGSQFLENASINQTSSSTEVQGGDGAYCFFDQDGTDRYYITNYVYNDYILMHTFNGSSWSITTVNSENSNNGAFINPEELDSNLDILYSNYSSSTGAAIRRYSGLKTGSIQKETLTNEDLTASPTAFKISPFTTNSSKLYVGTFLGDVLKVENANTDNPTWTEISGSNFVGSVSDIEFGATENDIFVTMHNYGVENIWYTNNGGATWQAKEGDLPDLPIKAILQNPLNREQVIIGTDIGVWYTSNFSNQSPNWKQAYNGMSNVIVTDLDLRNDNTVFAATYGRGVFSGKFTAENSDNLSNNDISKNTNVLNIYPTISNGNLTVKSSKDLGDLNINVFSLSGQNILSKKHTVNTKPTNLNLNLSSGIYLVTFSNNTFKETQKIIIK